MSEKRDIMSYFKQMPAPQGQNDRRITTLQPDEQPKLSDLQSSSPLSPCPSTIRSQLISPIPLRQSSHLNNALLFDGAGSSVDAGNSVNKDEPQQPPTSSFGPSFGSFSQRIIKNGKEVVISSDGEDTESVSSLDVDDLLGQFINPASKPATMQSSPRLTKSHSNVSLRSQSGTSLGPRPVKGKPLYAQKPSKYKFSLDALVHDASDDKKAEAKVAKAKLDMEESPEPASRANDTIDHRNKKLRDDLLTLAVGDDADPAAIQRLKDAVARTEAFDQGKTWEFFEHMQPKESEPTFPQRSILPGSWEACLKEPSSRDRAFLSGMVRETLSASFLPDELLFWILQSAVPIEPRDSIRYAYCSTLKRASAERISSLLCPAYIDQLFQSLGAKQSALATSEAVVPGYSDSDKYKLRDHKYLLSVLDVLKGLAEKFNGDTREHALKLAIRLALDGTTMSDCLVCPEVQETIISLLGEADENPTDLALYEISMHIFKTIQDVILQAQFLKHLVPTTPRLALFKARLALSFLCRDPSPLDRPASHFFDLDLITAQLRDKRFQFRRQQSDLDFYDLCALTSILDVAIDIGTATPAFATPREEDEFNARVDDLSDSVKVIFSGIQVSGASHLKRTEAKEALQAVHYRLMYGVRTKPRPKKSLFRFSASIDKYVTRKDVKGGKVKEESKTEA
ncbi:hypothetical protein AJ80_01906 [Polytolypa hystricis UAMH7299]|uniref:Uncharacterized protein n=1 Tax=Polytolypa hystricis (strain UAMH7299) TaxID=1447883 RepID=A0A2B7YZV5_POLH7|nr:hypothetical protein AJ80_01906 [Polytolypa hystricis UAMH7299]